MLQLKPWREVAVPHQDVLKGTFQQAEFAADLSMVHKKRAPAEYGDPVLFFQRTYITEGMRLLLDSVVRRLAGRGGDPVIQLQTAFGGGKTHTLLAVYHLARGDAPASELRGIPPILDAAGITELPRARVVVLDGTDLSPSIPRVRGGVEVRTLWGELAWQLGGAEAYERVREADLSGTSPGKAVLTDLLTAYAPCVILVDELVRYVAQFEDGKVLAGGTYDSNLSFVQALTEALKVVPNAIMLVSLPESEREAGSQRGVHALDTLSRYFGRVQALWKPVATEEAFEIVRRRLFADLVDPAAAEAVCRAFADYYAAHGDDFPHETQESRYYERLLRAYPIHPEVFDRLYEDWSSLENFQRTRGVLKLMAKVIYRLWKDGNNDLLIMPGSLPLYDSDTRTEAIYFLPQGWDPVVERDIDGERAETTEIESRDTRLGSVQACRRVARTIFLGSAPSTPSQLVRGLEVERILLGSAQPGQPVGVYKDALRRLSDRLHYLNSANNRFWFDTRPNLRREMEERKRRFQDAEDVFPVIRRELQRTVTSTLFDGIHVFTPSGDVPDDGALRLVVLPPDAAFSRTEHNLAVERAAEYLQRRGDQPRLRQNRLLFLALDFDSVIRLKDQVRSVLAWESIVQDIKDLKLNVDQFQTRQAVQNLEAAQETMRRILREAYRWLLAPMQEARPGKGVSPVQWEHFAIDPSARPFDAALERVLRENELVITEWAPIHLANLLRTWFWKDGITEVSAHDVWQKLCSYLYLPRLKDERVFRNTIAAGAASREFFGLAYGKAEGKYSGFAFGQAMEPIFDQSLLLIQPEAAVAYEAACAARESGTHGMVSAPERLELGQVGPGGSGVSRPAVMEGPGRPEVSQPAVARQVKRRFYGVINLDPLQAKLQFADVVNEVVQHFVARSGVKVRISVEIEAESQEGFDEVLQRTVRENSAVLKFKYAEFESGE